MLVNGPDSCSKLLFKGAPGLIKTDMKSPLSLIAFRILSGLSALLLSLSAYSQQKPLLIPLWPGQPPGSKISDTYKETGVIRPSDPVSPRVSKVTTPTLEIYLPAQGKAKGSAVVICPGGGYAVLAYDHEGQQVARWFQDQGVAAIILKYRLPSDEIMENKNVGPLQDVQEAIRTARRHAKEWGFDAGKIGIMGFSAGGHLAATATTMYSDNVYTVSDDTSARPDFSILVYAVISMQKEITHSGSRANLLGKEPSQALVDHFSNELQVNAQTPPAFLIHAQDDTVVPVENSLRYFQSMKKNGVAGELHIHEKGGHGFGLKGPSGHWTAELTAWMKSRGWL